MEVSINGGSPKCMIYHGKSYQNGWFEGSPIYGNLHIQMTQDDPSTFGRPKMSRHTESVTRRSLSKSRHVPRDLGRRFFSDPSWSQRHRTNKQKKNYSLSLSLSSLPSLVEVYLWNDLFFQVFLSILTHEPSLATEVHTFHHWEALGRVAILVHQTCKNAEPKFSNTISYRINWNSVLEQNCLPHLASHHTSVNTWVTPWLPHLYTNPWGWCTPAPAGKKWAVGVRSA